MVNDQGCLSYLLLITISYTEIFNKDIVVAYFVEVKVGEAIRSF